MGSKKGKNFYFISILKRVKDGKSPYDDDFLKSICSTKQRLRYYINQLQVLGVISNPAYGIWELNYKRLREVKKQARVTVLKHGVEVKNVGDIRGHGFRVKLFIPEITNWENRISWLKKEKIKFKFIKAGFGGYPQIFINKWKVWLCSDALIIYSPKGYSVFSDSSKGAYDVFVRHLATIINKLEKKLKTKFLVFRPVVKRKVYDFRVFGSHYSHVRSALARLQGSSKLQVVNEYGLRFLVDNSFNLLEFEAVSGKNRSMNDIEPVKKLVNDVADGKFDADKQNQFNNNFQAQQVALVDAIKELEINIRSHVSAIKSIEKGISEFTNFVSEARVFMQKRG